MCPLIHSYVSDTQEDVGLGRVRNRSRRRKDRAGQDRTAALVVQFVVT